MMSKTVVSAAPSDSLQSAAQKMQRNDVGCLPVIQHGKLEGIITDRDMVMGAVTAGNDPKWTSVSHCQQREVWTVDPQDDIKKAIDLMKQHQVRRLPVMEKGQIIGMISLADIARKKGLEADAEKLLSEISKPTGQSRKM